MKKPPFVSILLVAAFPALAFAGQEPAQAIVLPIVGRVDAGSVSPSLFTTILAALDSINPVAFFVLFFVLGLMMHEKSRRRMLLIGGTFVFFSGAVYFLFIAAWLNVFLFVGHLGIVTTAAGIAALIAGAVNVKNYFAGGETETFSISDRPAGSIIGRISGLLHSRKTVRMIIGAGGLAIAVNAYEMISSLGFPLIFTRGLTLFKLSPADYYFYLLLYCIVYVLPMAVIVLVVAVSWNAKKMQGWQGNSLNLASGFMMVGLGLVLLVKPESLNNISTAASLLGLALCGTAVIVFLMKNVNPDGDNKQGPSGP
jgi:hypothetical protein